MLNVHFCQTNCECYSLFLYNYLNICTFYLLYLNSYWWNMKTKLKDELQKQKIKNAELAKVLNVDVSMISKYSMGKSSLNDITICKIADFLHISTDRLLGRDTNEINLASLNPKARELIEKILNMNNNQLNRLSKMFEILNEKED